MPTEASSTDSARALQRDWWRRLLMVFTTPRPVFAALRDESDDAVSARGEPILAAIFLAGIASVLQTGAAAELLDDPAIDGALIFVWAVLGGAMYGLVSYWLGGLALYLGARGATAKGSKKPSYVRARHVLGFSAAPLALSLLAIWPIRLAIYGSDTFRTGGSDTGAGPAAFDGLGYAFIVWSFVLLLFGIRTTYRWSWIRAIGTVLLAALAVLCLVALFLLARA